MQDFYDLFVVSLNGLILSNEFGKIGFVDSWFLSFDDIQKSFLLFNSNL